MAATVGALRVTLGANTANFEAGMKRARREAAGSATAIQRSLSGIKGGFAGLATGLVSGAVLGGLVQLAKGGLEYASSLKEVSQQLGVSTEALQVFRYAATQAGMTQDEMDTSLKKLSDSIAEAGQGSKAQAQAFNELGVNVKTVNGELKSTDRVIREMADGFARLRNPQDQVRIGLDLMGRSGSKMVPLLASGTKGIDELTEAARKLGIVLSDKQIQDADKTADKLEEIKVVLSARLAGVVSDNAQAINDLADSLAGLASSAISAAAEYLKFTKTIGGGDSPTGSLLTMGPPGLLLGAAGAIRNQVAKMMDDGSVTIDINPTVKPFVPKSAPGLNPIVGSGGRKGGGGRSAESIAADLERKRQDALRRAYEADRDIADAKADELRAQQDLLVDYVDRGEIEKQLIDHETDQNNKALDLAVKLGDMDAITAEQVNESNERLRILRKQSVEQQNELDRQRDFEATQDAVFDAQRSKLEVEAALAETAAERRRVELEILELAQREQRERLQRIIEESRDFEEQKRARIALDALNARTAGERSIVLQGTRGPLEDFGASLPTTAEKMNESLQLVAVDGLRALEDGILSVIDGTKSLAEAFRDMASQIIADLLRIQIQRMLIAPLVNALGGALGGATGSGAMSAIGSGSAAMFASGGFTGSMSRNKVAGFVHGQEYVFDADAVNRIGIPQLEAIRKGAVMPANDVRGGDTYNMPISLPAGMTPKQARESGAQFAAGFQARLAQAKRQGF